MNAGRGRASNGYDCHRLPHPPRKEQYKLIKELYDMDEEADEENNPFAAYYDFPKEAYYADRRTRLARTPPSRNPPDPPAGFFGTPECEPGPSV